MIILHKTERQHPFIAKLTDLYLADYMAAVFIYDWISFDIITNNVENGAF